MKGKLIVIEGLDGCGKSTQYEMLKNELTKNLNVKYISFPDYDSDSSALVKMYLKGDFGKNPTDVNVFAASTFYAVDRYASYSMNWKKDYDNGHIILAARYTTSNAIYQTAKLPEKEWTSYIDWLSDIEYTKMGLPQPDLVIFLDMDPEVSQKLLKKRYNGDESKKDIHESNMAYVNKCRDTALFNCKEYGWKIIKCSENGEPLTIDEVHKKILSVVNNVLGGK